MLMVREGSMQTSKGEKQPRFLSSYDAYEQHLSTVWNDNPKGTVVMRRTGQQPTALELDLRSSQSEADCPW